MALDLFNVPHTSVRVTLRDANCEKTLDLSPVLLSYWSNFFVARYKPGSAWSESSPIDVEDVDVAEKVLRYLYDEELVHDEMYYFGAEWSDVITAIKTMDMFQFRRDLLIDALKLAQEKIKLVKKEDISGALEDMILLENSSVSFLPAYHALVEKAFECAGSVDSVPDSLRLKYLWYTFDMAPNTKPSIKYNTLKAIVEDLARAKDEAVGLAHLEQIHIRIDRDMRNNIKESWTQAIFDELALIEGDELSGSLILRARDVLMLKMKGWSGVKRKRGERGV